MSKLTVRHLTTRKNRDGSWRYYWQPSAELRRAGWTLRRLVDPATGGPCADALAAAAAAEAINAQVDAWRTGQDEPEGANAVRPGGPGQGSGGRSPGGLTRPGTVGRLIADYKASRYFTDLAPKTRHDYEAYLAMIDEWAGDHPVAALSAKRIRTFYDALCREHPRTAAYMVAVLRRILGLARMLYDPHEPGYIEHNPARQLSIASSFKGGALWTPAAIDAFVAAADAMGRHSIGTAVTLNAWLGQREGDLIALKRSIWRDGVLRFRQSKRGREVILPIADVPHLAARLEAELRRTAAAAERSGVAATTIIVSEETGRPYPADTFREWVRRIRLAGAETCPALAGLEFRWLRHTAVTRLAEAGVDAPVIARIVGWSPRAIAEVIEHYLIGSEDLAAGAFAKRLEKERRDG